MTTTIGNISAFSYSNLQSQGAGKLYIPVSKSALLYSHFDHVSGVAARSGQSGVSISKLQILNSLIDRASSITSVKPTQKGMASISETQMDSLIKNLHKQVQNASLTQFVVSGVQPMPGDLFSIQA